MWNHKETSSEVVTDTENFDILWWNIKNIKSNLSMSIYNEPNISLRVRYLINILCVPCCDVCYDISINMMFHSSFPPVVSNRAYLRYLYLCAYSCVQHICVRVVFFFGVPYVASFSGWCILSCPFGIVMPVTSRSVS